MTEVADSTKEGALRALDGMREVVRREMLTQGTYVSEEGLNPRLAGAICGGRRHCAIGSLWVGAGVKHRVVKGAVTLPGVGEEDRPRFLRRHPALKLAYDALNRVAQRWTDEHEVDLDGAFHAPIEDLFESQWGYVLTKRDLLRIISNAKRIVRAA